ncbi:hypothetical protein DNHGIG_15110 [Collibacillus ludicampi]|uniref:Uncharacterized protein n=1 Tax=Collibacillus ludicampi TaxID=2771369 RepID=A0AAV4LDT8_9BACL|nr:hypothetical protein [Collibacillus ludicampi]GIM45962.1 hypothetical protein DNHGIG_15110 [Collibacillus ludicampi]
MAQPIVYGPLELPSGKKIKFRRPTGLDRLNILQAMSISQEDAVKAGILMQTYLNAKVVTEVDGVPTDGNYLRLFNDWDDADITYYQAVFNEMFGLTEDKLAKAKDAAAFLLKSSTFTDGSNSQNNATVPSTPGSVTVMN